jgi:hypothetical protein
VKLRETTALKSKIQFDDENAMDAADLQYVFRFKISINNVRIVEGL